MRSTLSLALLIMATHLQLAAAQTTEPDIAGITIGMHIDRASTLITDHGEHYIIHADQVSDVVPFDWFMASTSSGQGGDRDILAATFGGPTSDSPVLAVSRLITFGEGSPKPTKAALLDQLFAKFGADPEEYVFGTTTEYYWFLSRKRDVIANADQCLFSLSWLEAALASTGDDVSEYHANLTDDVAAKSSCGRIARAQIISADGGKNVSRIDYAIVDHAATATSLQAMTKARQDFSEARPVPKL